MTTLYFLKWLFCYLKISCNLEEKFWVVCRRTTFRPAEKPKPTRFEWDEDLNDPTTLKPVEDAFKVLSHDGFFKISHPIILEPDGSSQNKEISDDSLKRSSDGSSSESPPYKRSRVEY